MRTRASILSTIAAFCNHHEMGRQAFGLVSVGDRNFVRDLESGCPITLGRIEKAEAFMVRIDADPTSLPALLQTAGVKPESRRRKGVALGTGETAQETGEGLGEGAAGQVSAHGPTVEQDASQGHREQFPSVEVAP